MNTAQLLLFGIPQLIFAAIVHEVAHGVVADWCGDATARLKGRITLNPLPHIDPFMTLILPGILILSGAPFVFGGAKPVPVNPRNLRPIRDMGLIAVAGPIVNFLLAFVYALLIVGLETGVGLGSSASTLGLFLTYGFIINLVLGLFNLTPIPPLDGGRIAVAVLPRNLARLLTKIEPYGLIIVIILLASGYLDKILGPALSSAVSGFLSVANSLIPW
jgi:Zn-dependent protease